MVVTMKNAVFWNDTPCGLVASYCFVPSSPILATMIGAISSRETSVLTRATRRNISEDDICLSHRREDLKSYVPLTGWAL
jgi:hypothetical protein